MDSALQTGTRIPVTALVSRRVRPGREADFEAWQKGIAAEAARFEGYQGITVLRPAEAERPEYLIILQFDHPTHLHRWMDSDVRRDWLKRCEPFIESLGEVRELTGMEHWFTLAGRKTRRPPPRIKMWLLSWLAGFVLATAITFVLRPWLPRLPWPLNLLLLTFLMTGLMTYLLMPGITRLFWRWLYPERRGDGRD